MSASGDHGSRTASAPSRYGFRTLARTDLPLVAEWLAEPHVREWWGDPAEELALIEGDLDEPGMGLSLVTFDGRPFAYVQNWDVLRYGDPFGQGPGTIGVDPFIGVPEMVGRGHGSRFLRAFVDGLIAAGARRVIIDPDPANLRAIRCYGKAGFDPIGEVQLPDGPVLLMARDADNRKTTT